MEGFKARLDALTKTPEKYVLAVIEDIESQISELQKQQESCEKFLKSPIQRMIKIKDEFGEEWTIKESEYDPKSHKLLEVVT